MTGRPMWFGPAERPLFARLYQPAGGVARGAVVLCPAFGIEGTHAGRACLELGEQLAVAGFAALHLDYDGTGDSCGDEDDSERVGAWQLSVRTAVDLMRQSGLGHVSLVGMRLGATLAASVSEECRPDALVLWDPCESGRSYLREQAILRELYVGEEDGPSPRGSSAVPRVETQGVETLFAVYGGETVRSMSELSIESTSAALTGRVLALLRPERPPRPALLRRLSALDAEFADATGQKETVDTPGVVFVPHDTLNTITAWLTRVVGAEPQPFEVARRDVAAFRGPTGTALVEEIKQLGPNQLFGIFTRSEGDDANVTVVLLNAGLLDHTGPGRLWVKLARSWARVGLSVLRVDLSGRGESSGRPGQAIDVVYPPEALDDVADIVNAVSPGHPSSVVLLGLCSGAYHAVYTGVALGVGGVVAVNPMFSGRLRELAGARRTTTAGRWVRTSFYRMLSFANRQLVRVGKHVLKGVRSDRVSIQILKRGVFRGLETMRWCVNRVSPWPRPPQVFRSLVGVGVDTFVLCGGSEGRLIRRGEESAFRHLAREQLFRMEILETIDHSLFIEASRNQVLQVLTEHAISRFAPPNQAARGIPQALTTQRDQ
jgi:pimeloyl-ACP methyl ester carboxylesterase